MGRLPICGVEELLLQLRIVTGDVLFKEGYGDTNSLLEKQRLWAMKRGLFCS